MYLISTSDKQSLYIAGSQEVIVRCPYCNTQAVVNLRPYRKQSKTTTTVYRGENGETQGDEEFQLPEVLPSRKAE